jgi:hypothetical protein
MTGWTELDSASIVGLSGLSGRTQLVLTKKSPAQAHKSTENVSAKTLADVLAAVEQMMPSLSAAAAICAQQ